MQSSTLSHAKLVRPPPWHSTAGTQAPLSGSSSAVQQTSPLMGLQKRPILQKTRGAVGSPEEEEEEEDDDDEDEDDEDEPEEDEDVEEPPPSPVFVAGVVGFGSSPTHAAMTPAAPPTKRMSQASPSRAMSTSIQRAAFAIATTVTCRPTLCVIRY